MAVAREVALSDHARKVLDHESHQFSLLDDIYRAFEWRLAREPDVGESVGDSWHVMRSKAWKAHDAAVIVALYTFTDQRVEVERIAIYPALHVEP